MSSDSSMSKENVYLAKINSSVKNEEYTGITIKVNICTLRENRILKFAA